MNVVVVGGGPAGMLAGIAASKNKDNIVTLIEKNEKLGKKLFITGKGRCNVTNDCDKETFLKNIVRNNKFLYSAFDEFDNKDFEMLLSENGCDIKVERGERVFPVSDKSYDVTDCLKRILAKQGVKILLKHELVDICVDAESVKSIIIKNVDTNKKESMQVDKLIIATGGISYKSTGSTGDGYRFARKLGINVIDTVPSLVPLEIIEKNECKILSGLALKNVRINIYKDEKIVYKDFGEMNFTDSYIDGPMILSASAFLDFKNNDKFSMSIDLKPALDIKKLDDRILRDISTNNNADISDIIYGLLPSQMAKIFMNRIDNVNINVSEIKKDFRKKIVALIKDFRYNIIGKRSFDEAIITRGGIDVKEINPKTMESKKIKGLYFAGEVIDVDALTGGFNIQIAASTGYVAGSNLQM